jgi:hypothetical protein
LNDIGANALQRHNWRAFWMPGGGTLQCRAFLDQVTLFILGALFNRKK